MSEIVIRVHGIENPHDAVQLPDEFYAEFDRIDTAVDCYGGCWSCGEPIGWVLHDDDDNPRKGVIWHAVWLASEDDGPVAALCEDCAPDVPHLPFKSQAGGAR